MKTLIELLPTKEVKKSKVSKVSGYIIYEGKSIIDNSNIVGIITLESANTKTGNMAQLWILSSDINPVENSKLGLDKGICGDCKLRQSKGGACYVNIGQAPLSIYKSYKKGNYNNLGMEDFNILNGISLRFGAYGDSYALPIDILSKLKSVIKNNTSYTHQWRENNEVLRSISMASVDSIEEQIEAIKLGWRTFRVAKEDSIILDNEIICPSVTKGVKCIDCNLCSGNRIKGKNIVIPIHGSWKKNF